MKPLAQLDKVTILSEDVFKEIFEDEDEIHKARLILSLEERAEELGVKGKFTRLLSAYKKVDAETRKEAKRSREVSLVDNWTNFTGPYDRMQCRSWSASDDGIYTYNSTTGAMDAQACYHPILPVERMKNLETGEEQIKLAYKRNGRWSEIIVPKVMITSASKIVSLSARGIAVTSENAKLLVKYLADVENANDDYIKVQFSSSKLGWIGGGFLPYDKEIVFDGDVRFRQIADSIEQVGNRNKWFEHVLKLRKTGRIEIKMLLAASFSSVLVQPLGGLPYFVDLWGETEGGKTVALMVAASVWANPDENAYIKDYKGTEVGLEIICDLLNHLPLILDDSSKKNRKIEDNFEGLVYDLCSGKGKTRSNKDLGLNRENHWKNCILTNGERPLSSYVAQGGAINRILEVECGSRVFEDPLDTVEVVKGNYGYAGKEFVDVIKDIGIDRIREIQQDFLRCLECDDKMQKQALSLSIILTADKLATDYLFHDGQYIGLEDARKTMVDRDELSDNERCYRYLMDKISMNAQRFDPLSNVEKWGMIEHGNAYLYPQAFTELCQNGGFSRKSFSAWAIRKCLIEPDSQGKTAIQKKVDGKNRRCVCLHLEGAPEVDENGFVSLEDCQETLPFD